MEQLPPLAERPQLFADATGSFNAKSEADHDGLAISLL
jgi:hypothetical protein